MQAQLVRASSATFAPRAPKACAVARPMPPLAPVTTTTWGSLLVKEIPFSLTLRLPRIG